MTIKAYYGLRSGGSGGRPITTAAEAEKILKGGYGVTNVRLENEQGDMVGQRWKDCEHRRPRWYWFYEKDAFTT
jgi:hypothetical protein